MSFDAVADIYDETRIVPNWVLLRFYEKILMKETRLNHDLVVLDAGIGTGRTVEPLLDFGTQLVGVDISKKMLKKMVEKVKGKLVRNQVNLICCDVTNLPFRTCSFDMVISIHVLHLLRKAKCMQAILEAKRVLKPKGSFIVAGHNQPELENEVGKKYLDLVLCTFRKRGVSKKPSTRSGIFEKMRVAKVFEHKTRRLLNRVLEKAMKYNYSDRYVIRKASSTEIYVIVWKETISISKIVDLLNKRFSSLEENLSPETFEKIKYELAKWRIEKMKENPFLEVRREFRFIMAQFRKPSP